MATFKIVNIAGVADNLTGALLSQTGFPFYNIVKINEEESSLEFALAGYDRDEISVTSEKNQLVIEGKPLEDKREMYVRGIAKRAFKRTFDLMEHTKIGDVNFAYGILSISLKREIPEEAKPKKHTIN